MGNEVVVVPHVGFNEMERMATAIAKSGLFGMKTPDQALALMVIAQAEGLHPAIAARDYHIIQGRPSLKADAMLARFQAAGGKVEWTSYTDLCVAATFSHPSSPRPVSIDWDIDRASRITFWNHDQKAFVPLTSKDNWVNYPRQMLRARVVSEGVRTVFPGVLVGMYTPEELQDVHPGPEAIEAHFEPVKQQPAAEPADPRGPAMQGQPIASAPLEQQQAPLELKPPQVAPPQPEVSPYASEAQQGYIQDVAMGAGISPDMIYARYSITRLAHLPREKVSDALKWLRSYDLDDSAQIPNIGK